MDKYAELLHRAKWRGLSVQENVTYEQLRKRAVSGALSLQDKTTYEQLQKRVESSVLSPQELAMVASELQKSKPETTHSILLHILGSAYATKYRSLIESFLLSSQDPTLARLALDILCDDWKLAAEYRGQILLFMRGVPWDKEEDVRLMALSKAGQYLRSHSAPELLHELLHVFVNQHERQLIREVAYCALARAIGRNWDQIPPASRHMNWDTEFDPKVIQEAKQRLAQQKG